MSYRLRSESTPEGNGSVSDKADRKVCNIRLGLVSTANTNTLTC